MRDQITTLEQARAFRYNRWAGNPDGWPYAEGRCCKQIHESGRGGLFYQCSKKNGHGPAGLYCKQHDPALVAEKRRKRDEADAAKWDAAVAKARLSRLAPKMLALLKEIRDHSYTAQDAERYRAAAAELVAEADAKQ